MRKKEVVAMLGVMATLMAATPVGVYAAEVSTNNASQATEQMTESPKEKEQTQQSADKRQESENSQQSAGDQQKGEKGQQATGEQKKQEEGQKSTSAHKELAAYQQDAGIEQRSSEEQQSTNAQKEAANGQENTNAQKEAADDQQGAGAQEELADARSTAADDIGEDAQRPFQGEKAELLTNDFKLQIKGEAVWICKYCGQRLFSVNLMKEQDLQNLDQETPGLLIPERKDQNSENLEEAQKPEEPQDTQKPEEQEDTQKSEEPQGTQETTDQQEQSNIEQLLSDQQRAGEQSDQQRPEDQGEQGAPGQSEQAASYSAATTLDTDTVGASYSSTTGGENALTVDGEVSVTGATITKTGDSSDENADFYGTNAAVLVSDGDTLTLSEAEITTDASHANAVFAYGTGSILISNSAITTTGNNSGGIMVTGGGTLTASNLTVSTSGNSSAAIRSDRGGGTLTATEGTYSTSGVGSPAIYSTADITVNDATLSAGNSEAVVIEGGNSVTITDSDITGNDATLNGQSQTKTNVLIYQSMSGDASEGTASFTMTGGSMTAETGTMFYVTNTTANISLSGVTLNYAEDSEDLLIVSAGPWGNSGSNGGAVTFDADAQTLKGNITVDSISSLALNLTNGSEYTGAINTSGSNGSVNVVVDATSTWTLTADSYVDSLDCTGTINLNGHTLYVNGVAWEA